MANTDRLASKALRLGWCRRSSLVACGKCCQRIGQQELRDGR